ncbi:MAG: Cytochrome c biogenesis protein, transmembrane region [Candidatus Saccharibacteria bacterium GW2011_GWC2_48_9]|nr:MAG: Cytochrome c biogenesis protein, transmembrane region [Candidatus Saccharibacteria bacterium GW2011_GWC2_48_9]
MTLLIVSFLAGVLTVAAPCILPLIPVIVGGSIVRDGQKLSMIRPLVITASLAVSIILFTLALKLSTTLLGVPSMALQYLSGIIIVLFGINLLLPNLWETIAIKLRLQPKSMQTIASSQRRGGLKGDILLGAALGPIFSSCSPTYALIVAAVLPQSFGIGLLYLVAYVVGLAGTLLMVVYLGREFARKIGWLAKPNSVFIRVVGILLIATGAFIIFGIDKHLQTFILEQGWYAPIEHLEQRLMR